MSTPRLVTAGTLLWRWEGTAFGDTPPNEDPNSTGTDTVINLRFPGQYYDAETGFDYNWNRYYDPSIGRYVSSDSMGLDGGLNTYEYVGANPLRSRDPYGLARKLDPNSQECKDLLKKIRGFNSLVQRMG